MITSRSLSSARAAQASARSQMPRGAVCTPGRRRTAAGLPFAAGCSGVTCHATVTSDTPPRACIHACMQIACKRLLSFSLTSVDQRAARAAAVSFASPGPSSTNFPNLSRPCRCDAIRAYQSPGVRMCLSVRCVRAYNSVRTVRVVLYVHFATYKDFGFTHEMAPKNTEHVRRRSVRPHVIHVRVRSFALRALHRRAHSLVWRWQTATLHSLRDLHSEVECQMRLPSPNTTGCSRCMVTSPHAHSPQAASPSIPPPPLL